MIKYSLNLYVFMLSMGILVGCSDVKRPNDLPNLNPTSITVTQDGAPLAAAEVMIVPVRGGETTWPATGTTNESGLATMKTNGLYDGAIEGKFKVVVLKQEKEVLPDPYAGAPDPKDEDAFGVWSHENAAKIEAAQKIVPKVYNIVDPKFGSEETTTLEVEITPGKNAHTVDVGKAIKEVFKDDKE